MKLLNEELNLMKYLINYNRGQILSEKKNILSEQTKSDYYQIANQLSSTFGPTLQKYDWQTQLNFMKLMLKVI